MDTGAIYITNALREIPQDHQTSAMAVWSQNGCHSMTPARWTPTSLRSLLSYGAPISIGLFQPTEIHLFSAISRGYNGYTVIPPVLAGPIIAWRSKWAEIRSWRCWEASKIMGTNGVIGGGVKHLCNWHIYLYMTFVVDVFTNCR